MVSDILKDMLLHLEFPTLPLRLSFQPSYFKQIPFALNSQ